MTSDPQVIHRHFDNARVLVTGGLGFLGSNLAIALVDLGARVTLVDSLVPEYGGNLHNIDPIADRVRVNVSDVRDQYSMEYLIRDVDYLFNFAGQTSHMDSMSNPFTDLAINCTAQLAILEACRKFNPGVKIVFAGTRQLYGRPDYLPVDEAHPVRPVDVNGVNKMAGEWYHLLYNNVYGVRTCSLRLTNTVGPRMRIKDARQTFVGYWIRCLLEGRPFEVWGGQQLRDFTYVDDVVDAALRAALSDETWGMVFNVGGPDRVTLLELADLLIDINGNGSYLVHAFPEERKRIDVGDYFADDALLRRTLDWRPAVGLREAFIRTINFYRESLDAWL
jgi:UDP-glucose 4-epimerase